MNDTRSNLYVVVTDTETTGLDRASDVPVEVAAILYDVRRRQPVRYWSALFPPPAELRERAIASSAIHGIPIDMLDSLPGLPDIAPLKEMMSQSVAMVAHNAPYDRAMYANMMKRYGLSIDTTWICSANDLVFPAERRAMAEGRGVGSRQLKHLALDNDIVLVGAHRAVPDATCVALLMSRTEDLEAQVMNLLVPRKLYNAVDCEYKDREKAKAAGWRWNGEERHWQKRLRDDELKDQPFKKLVPAKNQDA